MEKINRFSRVSIALVLSLTVAACGGGGDVAGDTEDFFTNPDEWNIISTGCRGGSRLIVSIVGGTPPFRIHNPSPTRLQVDRTEVSGKDPKFAITTLGGCFEYSILVLDYHSRSTTIDVTVEEEDVAAVVVP